jgi:cyclomaltodextrinase
VLLVGCSSTRADSQQRIELGSVDADVWAYELTVSGELVGGAELKACQVHVGERISAAELSSVRAFRARVRLDPGDNQVHAVCRTRDGVRAVSPARLFRVRLPATPIAVARLDEPAAVGGLVLDASGSRANPSTGRALVRYEWFAGDAPIGEGARFGLSRPAQRQTYSLRVCDDRGFCDVARVLYRAPGERELADEARSAVMYGVLPPLYGTPPLRAVSAALPSLADLGVDVLWLAPVFRAPAGDFGYAVTDYFDVRADYGSDSDLRELVAHAHTLGLRVLLDLPANHSSQEHPYFAEAKALGQRSHYFDFYDRDRGGQPTHYFDWTNLPNFNYAHSEVSRFMTEVAAHWLTAFAVDGYRLDAAWGIQRRNPEWWPQLEAALSRTHPEHWLVAEASARDAYYRAPLFEAAYDWTEELGKHSWKDVFEQPSGIAQRLAAALRSAPEGVPVLRFLNNNDTGARFITRHGPELNRVATAALLTLPGLPCLYAFDEVGAEFEPYSKLTPVQKQNPTLRAFHREWIRLRHKQRALTGPGLELVHVGKHDEVLAYVRSDGDARALVVLSFSGRPVELSLDLSDQRWPTRVVRELTGKNEPRTKLRENTLRLQLSGWDTRVYVPQ